MLRRLLNIASIVCLVLCVALMGMWVRSYYWMDDFTLPYTSSCEFGGGSVIGRLVVGVISGQRANPLVFRQTPVKNYASELANLDQDWATFAGFGVPKANMSGLYAVMFPHWFAVVIAAACGFATRPRDYLSL